jgi:hypothetical protein
MRLDGEYNSLMLYLDIKFGVIEKEDHRWKELREIVRWMLK